jgi:hypothetical protein
VQTKKDFTDATLAMGFTEDQSYISKSEMLPSLDVFVEDFNLRVTK